MARSSLFGCVPIVTFLCLSLLLTVNCGTPIPPHRPEDHVAFFIFGDSLLDAGNNNYLNIGDRAGGVNVKPYGETFFKHPTGRFSDGRIPPDFIAEHAKLPFIPPFLQPGLDKLADGVNFASGGAGVLPGTNPGTINLQTQLQYFENVTVRLKKQLGDLEGAKLVSRSVYLFSMGGNDYATYYNSVKNTTDVLKSPYTDTFIGMVLGNFTNIIRGVHKLGGRKFLFQNVGPIGCMPGPKYNDPEFKGDCIPGPSGLALRHNAALSKQLEKLQQELPGFKYGLYDYNKAVLDRTLDATSFGFKHGKSACCGSGRYRGGFSCGREGKYELCANPSEYVWFDAAHPTEHANRQVADLLWEGKPPVVGPYNARELFSPVI